MNTTPDTPHGAPGPNRLPLPLVFEVHTGAVTTPADEASERGALVTVRGEVDMATASQLVDAIEGVVGTAVVDLSAVTFIDSTGIQSLVQAQEASHERGDGLILRNPSPSVRRMLEVTGLIDVFPVEDQRPISPE